MAVVVGGFAIYNVTLARRAYVDGAWDRKVAQARLVWTEVGPFVGKSKGMAVGDMGRRLLDDAAVIIGDAPEFYELREVDGERGVFVTRDLTIFRVRITNNSNEPVSQCAVSLRGSKPMYLRDGKTVIFKPPIWEHHPHGEAVKVLGPGKTVSLRVVVPVPLEQVGMDGNRVTLTFTDSAGHRWSRTNTGPVQEVPKHRPPRLQELRAWKYRTLRKVKALRKPD